MGKLQRVEMTQDTIIQVQKCNGVPGLLPWKEQRPI